MAIVVNMVSIYSRNRSSCVPGDGKEARFEPHNAYAFEVHSRRRRLTSRRPLRRCGTYAFWRCGRRIGGKPDGPKQYTCRRDPEKAIVKCTKTTDPFFKGIRKRVCHGN